MSINVVIMAAGKGTRMKSNRPKVLHRIAGLSLLQHVLRAVSELGARHEVARTVVLTGHGAAEVEATLDSSRPGLRAVRQEPQLGTGHAIQMASPHLAIEATSTLILNGDVPLINPTTCAGLVDACGGERLALLTVMLDDPSGYGRIVRDGQGQATGIVEHKDATAAQREVREVYTGVMAAPTATLQRWVGALRNHNSQGEYYLTDIVAMAVSEGVPVVTHLARDETEVLGVNSPAQLADLERRAQRRTADALMEGGVRLADPTRLDVRGSLRCATDVEIDVNCVFEGEVSLGEGVRVGPNCFIRNASIDAGAVIHAFSHIEGDRDGVQVGAGALVGPFARLRPGAVLGADVHIGNFVEVKNSTLARGAKANHLAYLGDSTVGERVNFGAGSITANYDGANKHRTVIGSDVHVGSNCVLIAPVTLGDGATVGGGSTIAKDAPAGQLTVARAKQVSISGWKRPSKASK